MQAKLLFILFLSFTPFLVKSQNNGNTSAQNIVKITGITVTNDSLKPVPFTNVMVKGNYTGTMGDYAGFFSIVAKTGDTLIFSNIGYKNEEYVIPDSLDQKQYSLIQMLNQDTVQLAETRINVWPSFEQFKQAFLNTNIKDNDLARAKKNLDSDILREQAINLTLGAAGNQQYMADQHKSKLYYSGQLPPNNLLNPVAWTKLIQAWKDGKFDD